MASYSRAVLTFYQTTHDNERANLIQCLYKLRNLADQALFLPYVKVIFCYTKLSATIHEVTRRGSMLDYNIRYYFENREDLAVYAELISSLDGNAYHVGVMTSCQENLELVRHVTKYFLNEDRPSYASLDTLKESFHCQKMDFLKACLRNIDQRATARIAEAVNASSGLRDRSLR